MDIIQLKIGYHLRVAQISPTQRVDIISLPDITHATRGYHFYGKVYINFVNRAVSARGQRLPSDFIALLGHNGLKLV